MQSTEKTYTLTKEEMQAFVSLYEFTYDLLGGDNAPDDGDAPEFKAANKVLKKHAPNLDLKPR